MARLSLYSDRKLVWSVRLEEREYLAGRDDSCELVLPSLLASRQHFTLSPTADGGFLLEDLKSENGTYVDGLREYRRVLKKKATIQVGDEVLLFDPDDDSIGQLPPESVASVPSLQVGASEDLAGAEEDEEISTHGVGPVVLRRMQAEVRLRSRPHLSLQEEENERLFALDAEVNQIGYGPVRISLGPAPKQRPMVLVEVIREGEHDFVARAKGMFAKVKVNGEARSKHRLRAGDKIEVESRFFLFRPGLKGPL